MELQHSGARKPGRPRKGLVPVSLGAAPRDLGKALRKVFFSALSMTYGLFFGSLTTFGTGFELQA